MFPTLTPIFTHCSSQKSIFISITCTHLSSIVTTFLLLPSFISYMSYINNLLLPTVSFVPDLFSENSFTLQPEAPNKLAQATVTKSHRLDGLTNRNTFLGVLEARSGDASMAGFCQNSLCGLWKATILLCPHMIGRESESKLSGVFSYMDAYPIIRAPLHHDLIKNLIPNNLPKASSPNWEFGLQNINLGERHKPVDSRVFPEKANSLPQSFYGPFAFSIKSN